MKKITPTIALCALTLALIPAGRSFSAGPDTATNFWPFKEGNTWATTTAIGGQTLECDLTVTKVAADGDAKLATIVYKVNDTVTQTEIYRADASGISRVASGADGSTTLVPPLPIIQYPMKAGNKWTWTGKVNVGTNSFDANCEITVIGVETIKIPAGEFKATHVQMNLTITPPQGADKIQAQTNYWFVPGVGLVQQDAKTGNTTVLATMTSYKLKD